MGEILIFLACKNRKHKKQIHLMRHIGKKSHLSKLNALANQRVNIVMVSFLILSTLFLIFFSAHFVFSFVSSFIITTWQIIWRYFLYFKLCVDSLIVGSGLNCAEIEFCELKTKRTLLFAFFCILLCFASLNFFLFFSSFKTIGKSTKFQFLK